MKSAENVDRNKTMTLPNDHEIDEINVWNSGGVTRAETESSKTRIFAASDIETWVRLCSR